MQWPAEVFQNDVVTCVQILQRLPINHCARGMIVANNTPKLAASSTALLLKRLALSDFDSLACACCDWRRCHSFLDLRCHRDESLLDVCSRFR